MDFSNNKNFQDFFKNMTPKCDMNEILELYKKNLEFLTTCNKVFMGTMQTIFNMNFDFFKEQSANAKHNIATMAGEKKPQDCMKDFSEAMSQYVKDYSDHLGKIKDEFLSSGTTIADLTKNTAKENLDKMKDKFSNCCSQDAKK